MRVIFNSNKIKKVVASLSIGVIVSFADGSGSGSGCPSGQSSCTASINIGGVEFSGSKCCSGGCSWHGHYDPQIGQITWAIQCD